MKKLNLNLGDKVVLTKQQMKKISGGYTCIIYKEGDRDNAVPLDVNPEFDCATQSQVANDVCVIYIQGAQWPNCHYDCGCDGWGH